MERGVYYIAQKKNWFSPCCNCCLCSQHLFIGHLGRDQVGGKNKKFKHRWYSIKLSYFYISTFVRAVGTLLSYTFVRSLIKDETLNSNTTCVTFSFCFIADVCRPFNSITDGLFHSSLTKAPAVAAIYKYNTSSSISLVLFCCLYKSVWRSIVWDNKPSLFIKRQQGGDGGRGGPKYLYWRLICRPGTSVSVHPFPVWLSVMCKRDRWRKRRFSWHFASSWPHQPTISAALRPFSDVLCVTQTTADDKGYSMMI
jgi:hypothetical protein